MTTAPPAKNANPNQSGPVGSSARRVVDGRWATTKAPAIEVDAPVLVGEVEDHPAGARHADEDGRHHRPEDDSPAAAVHVLDQLQAIGDHGQQENADVGRPDIGKGEVEDTSGTDRLRADALHDEVRGDHGRAHGRQARLAHDPRDADKYQQSHRCKECTDPERGTHQPQPARDAAGAEEYSDHGCSVGHDFVVVIYVCIAVEGLAPYVPQVAAPSPQP